VGARHNPAVSPVPADAPAVGTPPFPFVRDNLPAEGSDRAGLRECGHHPLHGALVGHEDVAVEEPDVSARGPESPEVPRVRWPRLSSLRITRTLAMPCSSGGRGSVLPSSTTIISKWP